MMSPTIVQALASLGIDDGYAANEAEGIILWTHDEPQPTEAELIAAGWIKPGEQAAPQPVEEEGASDAPVADSSSSPSDS